MSDRNDVWRVGANYFIRTVTMNQTGRLVEVTDKELVLENAAWIADTGRFANAMEDTEQFLEVEPWPKNKRVIVGRSAIIDAVEIDTLPMKQK